MAKPNNPGGGRSGDVLPRPRSTNASSVVRNQDKVSENAKKGRSNLGGGRTEQTTVNPSDQTWKSDFDSLPTGKQSHVKIVGSEAELRQLFDQWTQGAQRMPARGPKIPDVFRLPDMTVIQWRTSSRSGGATIDIFPPNEKALKVHVDE